MNQNLCIIIPAYNEAAVIATTIASLRKTLKTHLQYDILVVNDGSGDATEAKAMAAADIVLTHRLNRGLGAALGTGLEYAKRHAYSAVITFDADGQHDPRDINKALSKLAAGADIVIGSRFLGTHTGMPKSRRLVLLIGDIITYLAFGVKTTDSQSGFRALSARAIRSLSLRSNRMEVSSEFFGEVRRLGLRLAEIPIHIRYTRYSLSKGQKNSASLAVLIKLLYKVFG